MTISLECFEAALDRSTSGVDDWVNPKRLLAKAAASSFGLAAGELSIFDEWWKLSSPARDLHRSDGKSTTSAAIDDEPEKAFKRLAAIVKDGAKYTERGYRHIHRVSGKGRFVIFSDHHMGPAGSRQDFFGISKNNELYAEILTEYADAGFTLIENGDVEELIIHEPGMPSPTPQLELLKQVKDTADLEDRGWDALDELRTDQRLARLVQVILKHRTLYKQINEQFVDPGRYIRIAGNHDQDTQDIRFLEVLRKEYPKLEQIYDFVILEPANVNDPTFVVGHGHHFDRASTPKYSRRIGETLSECLGWAYEGADRVWRWDHPDGVKEWAIGNEGFFNTLVTDDLDGPKLTFGEAVKTGLVTLLDSLARLVGLGGAPGASLADKLSDPGFWESTYGHNIAWEYFQSSDPGEAILNEMFCGKRWMKARHLDEIFINDKLEDMFGSEVPYLVLGHSHEPRHQAVIPAGSDGKVSMAVHYLNSGAAGRFGNLIWCVEIIDGVPQVVAWHRPGGPDSSTSPERRIYTPITKPVGRLIASDQHVPLPPVEQETISWLEPVLHMMMS